MNVVLPAVSWDMELRSRIRRANGGARHSLTGISHLSKLGIQNRDLSETAQTINEQGTTIVPLEVKTGKDGDVYIRAIDPAYAVPGPDEAQRFQP